MPHREGHAGVARGGGMRQQGLWETGFAVQETGVPVGSTGKMGLACVNNFTGSQERGTHEVEDQLEWG